jgi:hypothetical protein
MPAIDVKQPAGPPLGAAVLADCLRAPQDSICSSGLRRAERAVVSGAIAPGAPGNLTATVTGSSVALAWNAPTSGDAVVSYVIEAGSTSGASNLANLLTNSTATSYLATGVGQGTYFVRIRAVNTNGQSGPSNEVSLTVASSLISTSGTWSGAIVANDGGSPALTFTLTQSGSTVSGSTRLVDGADVATGSISGTASASSFSYTYNYTQLGCLKTFSGFATVSATTMTGTFTETARTPAGANSCGSPREAGTFALRKQ